MTHAPHPLRVFYAAETGRSVPSGPHACWFCAQPCAEGRRPEEVIRSTFSDMARARAGGDGPVCVACAFYLDFKILRPGQQRAMGLFTKTVTLWDGGGAPRWEEWERESMADDLLRWDRDGLPEPGYLTTNYSKQKHVLPWARRSEQADRSPWITTDQGYVRLPFDWPVLAWCFATLWRDGHRKGSILDRQLDAWALAKVSRPEVHLRLAHHLWDRIAGAPFAYLSYIITEESCDRLCDTLTERAAAVLGDLVPAAACCGAARDRAEPRRGRPVQKPLSAPVVGSPRTTR